LRELLTSIHDFYYLQYLFARKRFLFSFYRKNSEFSLQIFSDQLLHKIKSTQYRTVEYEIDLKKKNSYIREFDNNNISENIKTFCKNLLESVQIFSQNSLFRDNLFKKICKKIRNRNKTIIIRDIGPLIVFSAQTLVIYGATHLNYLYKCVNEDWNSIISFYSICSQFDYFVRFDRFAFTKKQLKKLESFVNEIDFKTFIYFITTTRIYFSFFICEIKCDAAALNVADRQNAHSIIVAVKVFVELFRSIKREKKFDRKIFVFSISHNYISVRIYNYYLVIEENKTIFYRYSIYKFDFTTLDSKKK